MFPRIASAFSDADFFASDGAFRQMTTPKSKSMQSPEFGARAAAAVEDDSAAPQPQEAMPPLQMAGDGEGCVAEPTAPVAVDPMPVAKSAAVATTPLTSPSSPSSSSAPASKQAVGFLYAPACLWALALLAALDARSRPGNVAAFARLGLLALGFGAACRRCYLAPDATSTITATLASSVGRASEQVKAAAARGANAGWGVTKLLFVVSVVPVAERFVGAVTVKDLALAAAVVGFGEEAWRVLLPSDAKAAIADCVASLCGEKKKVAAPAAKDKKGKKKAVAERVDDAAAQGVALNGPAVFLAVVAFVVTCCP
jgi:hypothetical protein